MLVGCWWSKEHRASVILARFLSQAVVCTKRGGFKKFRAGVHVGFCI